MPLTRDYTDLDIDALLHDMAREDGYDARRLDEHHTAIGITRRFCDTPPLCIEQECAPLVRTGQGSFARDYTPALSTGRRRASVLRWAIGVIVAVTFGYWAKGW